MAALAPVAKGQQSARQRLCLSSEDGVRRQYCLQADGERGHRCRRACGWVALSDDHAALSQIDYTLRISAWLFQGRFTCTDRRYVSGCCCTFDLSTCCNGWCQADHE